MERKKIEILQKCRKRKFLNNDDGENATTSDHCEHTDNNNDRDEDLGEKNVIINFELGKTQKGGNCLWLPVCTREKNRWNCSVRNCPARVTITDNKMCGYLGQRDHNHLPEPQKQQAESRRQKMLQCVKAEPRLKLTRLLAEVRRSTADETYVAMGSDNALSCMMRRQKKKILGNVDCANPLAFAIPEKLRIKNGEEIVLYDSRTVRIGEKDVVLVFGSERTLNIVSQNSGTWHLDGTFNASPKCGNSALLWERLSITECALESGVSCPGNTDATTRKCSTFYADEFYRPHQKRNVLSLPLLPTTYVRRAFNVIVGTAPMEMEQFLLYFARTYIGMTQQQLLDGDNAFGVRPGGLSPFSSFAGTSFSSVGSDHTYSRQPLQFGIDSPAPSTLSWPSTVEQNSPLVQYSMSPSSTTTLQPGIEKFPNNDLEATHLHFSKGLCHHPALSDFIFEVNRSIDKQVEEARSARNFVHKRHKRYVLQDAVIMRILADANNDAEIHDVMTALGLQVEGYAGKLKDYENMEDSIVHIP